MSQLTSPFDYRTAGGRQRRRPNISSLPLVTGGVMLLLMGGLLLAYFFMEPALDTTPGPEPVVAAEIRERSMPDAFAIQVRNEVLGGPYAVPEQAQGG